MSWLTHYRADQTPRLDISEVCLLPAMKVYHVTSSLTSDIGKDMRRTIIVACCWITLVGERLFYRRIGRQSGVDLATVMACNGISCHLVIP